MFENTEFGRMMSNLFRIEDETKNENSPVWITKNMLQKAYDVSPAFSKLKSSMETSSAWTNAEGESEGDLIVWKIRDVMKIQNYYETASKAQEFVKK